MMLSMIIFTVFRRHLEVANERSSVSTVLDVPLGPDYEDPRESPAVERKRIVALIVMCGIVMLFWLAFNQNGTAFTFWARDNTDRVIHFRSHTWEVPTEYYAAANSIFVISLTPLLVALMSALRKRNLEPSTPTKIGIGMVMTAASFGLMAIASLCGGNNGKVSMLWLIGCYFLITIGELFVSPLGLSMVTKLSPRRLTAMLMGVWFISNALGAKGAGQIGALWTVWPHSKFFGALVLTSLLAAAILVWQHRRLVAAIPAEQKPNDPTAAPTAERVKETSDPNAVPSDTRVAVAA
jgi:POT family proton-dependent oligopeptide transporter